MKASNLPPNARNLALVLAYDGTRYAGWQYQANAETIQGCVSRALEKICGHEITLYGCSRTDAGVHARAHVSNFYTDSSIPADKLPLALDGILPDDIVCCGAREVPLPFNARFDAMGKQYSYYLLYGGRALPQQRRYAYHERRALNLEAMHEAADCLLGTHDFRAFQAQGSPAASTERSVDRIDIRLLAEETDAPTRRSHRMDIPLRPHKKYGFVTELSDLEQEPKAQRLRIIVHASGFLYNMMRIIAGSLVYAGLEKLDSAQLRLALETGDRRLTGKTLPAAGLCLDRVDYPSGLLDRNSRAGVKEGLYASYLE